MNLSIQSKGVLSIIAASILSAFILNFLRALKMSLVEQVAILAAANLAYGAVSVAWGLFFSDYLKKLQDKSFLISCAFWSFGYSFTYAIYLLFPKGVTTEGLTIVRMLSPFIAVRLFFKDSKTSDGKLNHWLPRLLLVLVLSEEIWALSYLDDWKIVFLTHLILFVPITLSQTGAWKLSSFSAASGSHVCSLINGFILFALWWCIDKSHSLPSSQLWAIPMTSVFIWAIQSVFLYGLAVLSKPVGALVLSSNVALTVLVGIFQNGGQPPLVRLFLSVIYFFTCLWVIYRKIPIK